ncbi:MAG TPA: bile acid:sodium symporter family protein [Brevibacillus sp.]|nr:bile acid:sodium symporter family protein [Brevibacillus sp.]
MLVKLNLFLEKIMPILTPTSVVIGILAEKALQPYAFLSAWFFAFMTFSGSLGSGFRDFARVLTRPLPMIVNLVILHALMPFLAWGAASFFFPDEVDIVTGFVLAAVIPTGVSSMLWTSIYAGNMALTLSIILIDTMLSPLVVPLGLSLFVGANVEMDLGSMMKGMLYMVVLPSLAGMALHQITGGKVKQTLAPRLAPFTKLSMGVIVAMNSSVVAPYLSRVDAKLIGMAGLVLVLSILSYLVGWLAARLFGWRRDVIVTLTINSGMRNIGAGTVLAISYFPPLVALPVVLATLFQQSLAAIFGQFLRLVEKEQAPGQPGEKLPKAAG